MINLRLVVSASGCFDLNTSHRLIIAATTNSLTCKGAYIHRIEWTWFLILTKHFRGYFKKWQTL